MGAGRSPFGPVDNLAPLAHAQEATVDPLPPDEPDCRTCGACCREAFDVVAVEPTDPMRSHPGVTRGHLDGWRSMARVPGSCGGTQCAALQGDGLGAPWRCTIYDDRPQPCRALQAGSTDCFEARDMLAALLSKDAGADDGQPDRG